MLADLEALATAVGVLTDPASPEEAGTTLSYLLGAVLGASPTLGLWLGGHL